MKRLAVLLAIAALGSIPSSASAQEIELGHIPVCTQVVPAVIGLTRSPVAVDVRMLLDGVSQSRAEQIVSIANKAYAPESISLRATYQTVNFGSGATIETSDALSRAKSATGGSRPAGTDVVYALTSKDLTSAGQTSVAGQADCIGGVAFGGRAFAVGEEIDPRLPESQVLGLRFFAELSAKTLAHELGHLLGAHHHYANCVEALIPALAESRVEPCTLMFNDLSFQRLQFGQVEALAVRGHALRYAR